ncbi:MAG: cytidine deaminase [Gemmatimonadota bacterium]|nr:cytidine deaminase [Gemmatimonadota bacterium]
MEDERLLEEARSAMVSAYAPYSGFRVGAALVASDDTVWTGCNVENASYGLTMCAERVAVFGAVSAGRRAFRALTLVTEADEAVPPCGACLQVLSEFSPELTVLSVGLGTRRTWILSELLPERFGGSPSWLSRTDEKDK